MAAENVTDMPPPGSGDEDGKREQSTIAFPYMDLDDAIAVARGVHETTGASPCQQDQLAAKLNLSMNSSGFRMRLSAARLFGVIESDRGGAVRLTSVGQMIVDPSRERDAKVKAFLAVPLYGKLYEHYRGKVVPPTPALTRELIAFGVAQKQADRARQTFERSASTAGFFGMGRDKLIMPAGTSAESQVSHEESKKENGGGSGGGSGGNEFGDVDPLVIGLFRRLPRAGTDWDAAGRKKWLETAANIFDLIYEGEGGIKIDFAMAQRSPRPNEH
jgi:hypothetical protein